MSVERIEYFLNSLKAQGKCSPAGQYWNAFFEFLMDKNISDVSRPPLPLILAASAESPASKHRRLKDQLEWARMNNCMDTAIGFLTELKEEQWETSSEDEWNRDSYGSVD